MPLRRPVPLEPADAVGAVHFIAAGSGMSGIAAAYRALGVQVSGSDMVDSDALRHLGELGVRTFVGHDPAQLGDAATVVVSSAIRETNVELAEARRRGLRVWHRSAALAGLMVGRRGVAITGTHGKTTTTGMTATMLVAAGADPSYVIGSPLTTTGESAHLGAGEAFVIEADESDGSFLQYPAEIVVVTNIEADHLDNWGTPERYVGGFDTLCHLEHVALVLACADDPGSRSLAARLRAEGRCVLTYGEAPDADVRLTDVEETPEDSTAWLAAAGDAGPLRLVVPGRFNLLNAAAAYAVGRELGVPGEALRAAAARFEGTHRRFQPRGSAGGVRVFDDYAHHPTELRATLEAARGRVGAGRLVACFQPHLFSRTVEFAAELAEALTLADVVVCCGIYPAREEASDFPGVSGRLVHDALEARGHAGVYVEDVHDAAGALAASVRPGDLVLTLGAGDVTIVGPELVRLLQGGADVVSGPLIDLNGRVRDRAREQRQRRARRLLRAVSALAVLSALAWVVTASPLFSVRKVVIAGNRAVPTETIRAAAAIATGTPLARVDAAGAGKRLQSVPGVGRGDVTVSLPDTVTITVTERAVAFVVEQSGGYAWVDPTGAAFSQSAKQPPGVPLARVALGNPALLADIGSVVGALPSALAAKVTLLTADSRDSIALQTGDKGGTIVWGSAEQSPLKGQVAGVLFRKEPACARIDVSSPATPTTKC